MTRQKQGNHFRPFCPAFPPPFPLAFPPPPPFPPPQLRHPRKNRALLSLRKCMRPA
ncbi:hypothetical protein AB205_0111690 [Aquarana catesbeiana]|uniref:Uncharacterized protein n=1 Tax=Aquarana catesbeiana TaxID=8400 RepID=A0A2G9RRA2_AQUCT|nr:hypothetical protein AB205_0111690 [Aquarana catesbeiana]